MKLKYLGIGILAGMVVFLAFGIPTAVIPTGIFTRMVPPGILDYMFLVVTSAMLGAYVSLYIYGRRTCSKDYAAAGGAVPAFLAVSCPACSVILVSLFGMSAVTMYIEPLRPVLGIIGIGILAVALYLKARSISSGACSGRKFKERK